VEELAGRLAFAEVLVTDFEEFARTVLF